MGRARSRRRTGECFDLLEHLLVKLPFKVREGDRDQRGFTRTKWRVAEAKKTHEVVDQAVRTKNDHVVLFDRNVVDFGVRGWDRRELVSAKLIRTVELEQNSREGAGRRVG